MGQGLDGVVSGATRFVQDLRPWTNRSTANGGLPASTSTSDMGYLVLSAAAARTLDGNASLLALGNETDAAPAACTGSRRSAMPRTLRGHPVRGRGLLGGSACVCLRV